MYAGIGNFAAKTIKDAKRRQQPIGLSSLAAV